ncbi:MAG: P-type conjugative transfer protein TrbJ [Caulobacterales bacterium]
MIGRLRLVRSVSAFALAAAVALPASVVLPMPPAHALGGDIVFDPSNYAENVLAAARALEQINNQIRQIELQARMLAQNPLQLSPELAASIGEARELLDRAEGLAFDVRRIGSDLATLYPQTWEAYDLGAVLSQSDRWVAQSRASLRTAMEMEARAAQSIGQSREQIATALGSSAGAEGQTAAVQAGNQLLGVQAAQLTEIHALLVAQGRALQTERMERVAREERAGEIRRRAFPSTRSDAPPPARTAF